MVTRANDHRLAIVLHADAAGYSRLIAADEEGTHRRLREYVALFTEVVNGHAGRVVDAEGDSLLAEFPTVADALHGAARVQSALAARNAALPEHERLAFRIGINIADVFVDRERARLFANGINIAARLESLAEPGTACVSEAVRGAASTTLPFVFVYLGEFRLKNIATPVRAYRADSLLEHARADVDGVMLEPSTPEQRQASGDTHIPPPAFVAPSARTLAGESMPPERFPLAATRLVRVGQTLSRTWSQHVPVSAGYQPWLDRWLRWLRRRFGPRRGPQWKLFDFCLAHAFVYSSVAFFAGLVFFGGDNTIGALRVSYLEIGTAARSTERTASAEASGVAGVLPALLLVMLVNALLVRLWQRTGRRHLARHTIDAPLLLIWSTIVLIFAFALGLTGFGAGVVALSAALGAWQLRGMPGTGAVALGLSALVVTALGIITGGAARGDEQLSAIADALHGLAEVDVERFLILLLLLPSINALFDYLSWRASRRFALSIRARSLPSLPWVDALLFRPTGHGQRGEHGAVGRIRVILWWGAIDLAFGVALLHALAACLGFAFEMLDVIRHDDAGYYDVPDMAASLTSDPFGAGFWLSITLLTTLLPTAFHIVAVGSGLTQAVAGAVGARRARPLMSVWLVTVIAIASTLLGSEHVFDPVGWSMLAGAEFATVVVDLAN